MTAARSGHTDLAGRGDGQRWQLCFVTLGCMVSTARRCVLVLTAGLALVIGVPSAAGASVCRGVPALRFTGTALTINGSKAVLRVDEAPVLDSGGPVFHRGSEVSVDFASESTRLKVGYAYTVAATTSADGSLHSSVQKPTECPTGTINADGSLIDTGLFSDDRGRVLVVAAIGMVFLGWYRRRLVISNSSEAERVDRLGLAGLGI